MKPKNLDLSERAGLRSEMAHFRPEWADFRPERADLDELTDRCEM